MSCRAHLTAIFVSTMPERGAVDQAARERDAYSRTTMTEHLAWRTTLAALGPSR